MTIVGPKRVSKQLHTNLHRF